MLRSLATRSGLRYNLINMADENEPVPEGKRHLVSNSTSDSAVKSINLEECRADKSYKLTVEQKPSSIPKRRYVFKFRLVW